MVTIRTPRVHVVSVRTVSTAATTDPIRLLSACPTIGCSDERVRFRVNSGSDGLFSRDNRKSRDLFLAQRFARHVSPLTTTVYTHPSDQEVWEKVTAPLRPKSR